MERSNTGITHREYSFTSLKNEMSGIKVGRVSFSKALKTTLGDEEAIQWFYHATLPELKNQTPHRYIEKKGEKGKRYLASSLYYLITGQPD